ncbi:response regulator [Cyanobium sp. ATX 6F1]|uniref:response regulator n=1 Tax=unclassified Cyanobium TaxID=2627006 RepID=UPI0020CD8C0F|nr:response regulator [Cyanobium sp. ATX 6F1]MCP9915174.1 response regulator [Cyanobium sp. ATX 6F1]
MSGHQKHLSVAVVDDDPRIRELLALELADLGSTATVYASAEELLVDPQCPGFDLLLLDLVLPGIDGFKALQRLRAKGHQGQIVIISANWNLGRSQQLIAAGANDYIVKTSLLEQLPELLANLLPGLKPCPGQERALQSA